MIEIDGSLGEGGGQIIRSSLALAAVTGQSMRLRKIRAGRKKSGLLRQHLTAVKAAAAVCDAHTEGAEIGAAELTFVPSAIRGGDFRFQVGTAGSTSLVAQTILPALMLADGPSTITLEGGTHNPWAPPFDFLRRTYLPLVEKMGPRVSSELHSHGFYPAGGGRVRFQVSPCQQLRGFDLVKRAEKATPSVTAIISQIPKSVGQRECDTIRRKANWHADCFHVLEASNPRGPGNVVMVELDSGNVCELFTGFGRVGVKAEHVARGVLREARSYLAQDAPVGEHLADQLMLPLGLAASQGATSRFRTGPLSMHSTTHIDVLKMFLPIEIKVTEGDDRSVELNFSAANP